MNAFFVVPFPLPVVVSFTFAEFNRHCTAYWLSLKALIIFDISHSFFCI